MNDLPEDPYPGKPGLDSKQIFEACMKGEIDIFNGEKPTTTDIPDRLTLIPGKYLNVAPETLIDVAKHIADPSSSVKKTVAKAYEIICEAHLLSRNLSHWNEKAANHHLDPRFKKIAEDNSEEDANGLIRCSRKKVLVAFEKTLGNDVSETTASENFSEWIRESVRTEEFLDAIHFDHHDPEHDPHLFNMLIKSGWLERLKIGTAGYYLPPIPTSPTKRLNSHQPTFRSNLEKKASVISLETEPYWSSEDRWWPNPSNETLRAKRQEFLNATGQYFLSPFIAAGALERYSGWLEVWNERKKRKYQAPSSPRKDSESGQFIGQKRLKDRESGRFRKK